MTFSKGHALIIGVGQYANHPIYDVPVTQRDAEAVAEVLQDDRFCGYPATQVHLLTGEHTKRANIIDSLKDLADEVTEEQTVFLFLCSHGLFGKDGRWYFATHDMRLDTDKKLVEPETAISDETLIQLLKNIRAGRVLAIFNTCFSGNISPTLSGDAERPDSLSPTSDVRRALLSTGSGRIVVTSAGDNQKSYFDYDEELTIFTQALIDGLRGNGVHGQNGYISLSELYEMVYLTVQEETAELKDKLESTVDFVQQPELTIIKGVGPFAVALFRGTAPNLSDIPPNSSLPAKGKVKPVTEKQLQRAVNNILGKRAQQINFDGIVNGNVQMQQVGERGIAIGGHNYGVANTAENPDIGADRSKETAVQTHHKNLRQLLATLGDDYAAEKAALSELGKQFLALTMQKPVNKLLVNAIGEGLKQAAAQLDETLPGVSAVAEEMVTAGQALGD